ncbi:hypothetical protein ACH495_18990 [Micromonospora sp. NPDC018662]|uniref:hypothetical protein n=1 Tax=Micromonospora sp. NPDC018662 TaxID=3364238 RepID=UPI0037B81BB1
MSDLSGVQRQLGNLTNAVSQLNRHVHSVGVQVDVIGQEQQATRSDLNDLRLALTRLAEQAERAATLQRAETAIGNLKNDIEHQFGHHKVVRRTTVGMLHSFDLGLVSEETVQAVGEQLMIQTPRYWLAPVLVALAAWAGDDPELCVRAVDEAYRRSPERTSLLMMLVLRRQGRRASAVRWLRHYLDAQDPTALNREFAVILEAIAQGAFGPAALDLVQDRLTAWRRLLLDDEVSTRIQLDRWRREVETHVRPDGIEKEFPRLAATSPQWLPLRDALARAEAHGSLIERYTALLTAEAPSGGRIEDAIDDILDRLVDDYDPDELPLRRKLAAKEAIVAAGGDPAAATRAPQFQGAGLDDTRDYLTIQTESALDPESIGVSAHTQRLAVASCHDWLNQSHAAFTRDYRLTVPATVEVTLDLSGGDCPPGFRPPRWTGAFNRPMDALERSLGAHWDRNAEPFIAGLTFNLGRRIVAPVVVLVLALLILSGVANVGLALLITAAGALVWGLVLKSQADDAVKAQERAGKQIAASKKRSLATLRATEAELTDWMSRFKAADAREAEAQALIADLATAGAPSGRHERRVTDRIDEEE